MNLTNIETQVRWYTKTDSTTFSDANILREANNEYGKIIMKKVAIEGYQGSMGSQAYTDLKAQDGLSEGDNGYNGEYALPSDCLSIIRVEAKFVSDHLPVTLYDVAQNVHSEFTNVDDFFSTSSPKMRLLRESVFIRPFPDSDVTNGLYLEYISRQTAFSGATDEAEFEANFHDLIPMGVALRYFRRDVKKYGDELAALQNPYYELLQDFEQFYRDRNNQNLKIIPKTEIF